MWYNKSAVVVLETSCKFKKWTLEIQYEQQRVKIEQLYYARHNAGTSDQQNIRQSGERL